MMLGKVKWYNIRRGYGFIQGEDGEDVFVHHSDLPFWTVFLEPGEQVEFLPEHTPRGVKATRLKTATS